MYLLANRSSFLAILAVVAVAGIITVLIWLYIKDAIKELQTRKRDIELIDRLIQNRTLKVVKKRKVFKIIKNVLFYTFLVILIPFLAYAVIFKIKGNNPQIGSTTVMVVGSGSMSFKRQTNDYLFNQEDEVFNFQFKKGDIILLKKVMDNSDLSQYDVISYYDSKLGKNIIHRIRLINEEDGVIKYTTRGDANSDDDDFHPTINDIVGKYEGKKIIFLGNLILFLQDPIGIATFILLLYLLFMIDYFLKKLGQAEKEKMNYFASVIGYDDLDIKYIKDGEELIFDQEEINYLGWCYRFNRGGLIDKTQTTDIKNLTKENLNLTKKIYLGDEVIIEDYQTKIIEKGK